MRSPYARYVHEPLGEEVAAIAGHYELTREERYERDGRLLLYVVGHALFDTSCCGVGGCGYAVVPGYVIAWHAERDERGRPVSVVEPIRDPALQEVLRREILRREPVTQVQFG